MRRWRAGNIRAPAAGGPAGRGPGGGHRWRDQRPAPGQRRRGIRGHGDGASPADTGRAAAARARTTSGWVSALSTARTSWSTSRPGRQPHPHIRGRVGGEDALHNLVKDSDGRGDAAYLGAGVHDERGAVMAQAGLGPGRDRGRDGGVFHGPPVRAVQQPYRVADHSLCGPGGKGPAAGLGGPAGRGGGAYQGQHRQAPGAPSRRPRLSLSWEASSARSCAV